MSIRVNPDLFCDNCGNWEHGYPEHKAKAIRAKCAKKGWKRRQIEGRSIDLCPHCAKDDTAPTQARGKT